MAAAGLPDTLVFSEKPRAAQASKVRVNLPSINKNVFTPGELIQISIPTAAGSYLNCAQGFLKFKFTNKSVDNATPPVASAITLDHSAASLFRRLTVRLGSSVLEDVGDYNVLAAMIADCQSSEDRRIYTGTILEGAGGARTGAVVSASGSETYAIPLLSGVVGTLAHKMLPVGMMNNALVLELTLADAAVPGTVAANHIPNWEVSEVELVGEMVQVSPAVDASIRQMNAGGVRIGSQTFVLHSNTVSGDSASTNLLISSNASSAKTLFSVFRKSGDTVAAASKSVSGRYNPYGDTGFWVYVINGTRYPSRPVRSDTEAFAELQKSWHAFNTPEAHGLIDRDEWVQAATHGAYIVSQDLESFSHKPLAESGMNIAGSPVYLESTLSAAVGGGLTVSTFVHCDFVLVIDPMTGQAQTMF